MSPNFVFQLYRPYGRKVDQKQSSSRLNSFHESLFLKVGPQLSTSNFHVKRTSSPARLLLSSHRDSLLTMNTMMGQSFHPLARASEQRQSTFDGRPQTFSQCIIDGKLNAKRLCEYKKQSYEEFEGVVSELLYGNSLLQAGKDDEQHEDRGRHRHVTTARHPKQRRKEKQVVMFTDQISGWQLHLLPCMSLW